MTLDQIFSQIPWPKSQTPEKVATDILRLSNVYISNQGSPNIWNDPGLRTAYLHYFMPLNFRRALAVFEWLSEVGFLPQNTQVMEWGSGPGTLHLAAQAYGLKWNWECYEENPKAISLHQDWCEELKIDKPKFTKSWSPNKSSMFLASYVLNECQVLPDEAYQYHSLLLIEPSTQKNSRRLMEVRKELLNRGYFIWGPCTHQSSCPLLLHSKKDWCHFRIHWDPPQNYLDLEAHLPIKNRTLTLSYLAASKTPPQQDTKTKWGRVIGDDLFEKGKTRQAICRSDKKEFLSWLKRHGKANTYPNGTRIAIDPNWPLKGQELRVNEALVSDD